MSRETLKIFLERNEFMGSYTLNPNSVYLENDCGCIAISIPYQEICNISVDEDHVKIKCLSGTEIWLDRKELDDE